MHKKKKKTYFVVNSLVKQCCAVKKKKEREEILGPVQRREYLGSAYQTWRHFTPEHNGCCEVAYPLSIVRFSQPHPVLPHNTSPPLLLEKTSGEPVNL